MSELRCSIIQVGIIKRHVDQFTHILYYKYNISFLLFVSFFIFKVIQYSIFVFMVPMFIYLHECHFDILRYKISRYHHSKEQIYHLNSKEELTQQNVFEII